MTTTDQEVGSDEITEPFDCPIYRANMAPACITDCGLCVCAHCVLLSSEIDKHCTICDRSIGSHQFNEIDGVEVTDGLLQIKDRKIEKREVIIRENDNAIVELKKKEQDLIQQLGSLQIDMQNKIEKEQELTQQLGSLQIDMQDKIEKEQELTQQLGSLQIDMQDKIEKEQELTQQLGSLQIDMQNKIEKEQELTQQLGSLQIDMQDKMEENKHLTEKEQDLTQQLGSLQIDMQNKIEKEQELTQQLGSLQIDMQDKMEENKHLTEKEQDLTQQLGSLQIDMQNKIEKEQELTQQLGSLQIDMQDKMEENKHLTEKEQDLTQQLGSLQIDMQNKIEKEQELTQQLGSLQIDMQDKIEENKHLTEALTESKEEVVLLQGEVQYLLQYVELCTQQGTELQHLHETIIPEKDNTIAAQTCQVAQLSEALTESKEEVVLLQGEVQNLLQYVELCTQQGTELQHLHETIIPEKDNTIAAQTCQVAQLSDELSNTIAEFQGQVAALSDELATLKRNTMTLTHLEALPETNLYRAIQNLQYCYDREYRCRYQITDKMEVLLRTRLENVMNGLCTNPEIGDQLALVISTYVSMMEESANLHRSLKTQKQVMKGIKTELRQTKVNKFEMEQRNQVRRYRTEE